MRDSDRAQLGELVRSAFQRERARLQAVIEPHLRPTGPRTPRTAKAGALGRAGLQAMRREPLPLLVIGVALLSFSVTWLVSRPEPQPTAAQGELRQSEDVSPIQHTSDEVPARPNALQLTVSAHPASAVLYLDGVPLSDNPFSASVGMDHKLHILRASGAGLISQQRVITFDRDQVITLKLEPQLAHVPSPARKARVASRAPTAKAPPHAEATSGTRPRAPVGELFDTPLRVGRTPRPIYEDDPYK